jgi:hypothetical protein
MIHVITVHWKTDKWVDIQLRYLQYFIQSEFRVYASLTDILPIHYQKFHYHVVEQEDSHAIKLNRLANIAIENSASDEDWLIFIDGDAFPVAELVPYGKEKFQEYPLIAIQRFENNGDLQPHPCFCLTTIGFWKSIQGNWEKGYQWLDLEGNLVTDVGGNLLGLLREKDVSWYPMLRSNEMFSPPVLFGIYDGLIYHHGGGFREGTNRLHRLQVKRILPETRYITSLKSLLAFAQKYRFPKKIFLWLQVIYQKQNHQYFYKVRDIVRTEVREASQKMYQIIQQDFHFYKHFGDKLK